MDGAQRSGATGSQPYAARLDLLPIVNEETSNEVEVDSLLRQQNFELALQKAKTIRNPIKRETAFAFLIKFCLDTRETSKAKNFLEEIKDPRGYNILAAQICSQFIERDDAINARALCILFKEEGYKREFAERIDAKFGLDKSTLVKRIGEALMKDNLVDAERYLGTMKEESEFRDEAAGFFVGYFFNKGDISNALKYTILCRPYPRENLLKRMAIGLLDKGNTGDAIEIAGKITTPSIQAEVNSYFEQQLSGLDSVSSGKAMPPVHERQLHAAYEHEYHRHDRPTSKRVAQMTRDFFDYGSRDAVVQRNPLFPDRDDSQDLLLKLIDHALSEYRPDAAEAAAERLAPGSQRDEAYKKIALYFHSLKVPGEAFRVKDRIKSKSVHKSLEESMYGRVVVQQSNTSSSRLPRKNEAVSPAPSKPSVQPTVIQRAPGGMIDVSKPEGNDVFVAQTKMHIKDGNIKLAWSTAKMVQDKKQEQQLLLDVIRACFPNNAELAWKIVGDLDEINMLVANDIIANAAESIPASARKDSPSAPAAQASSSSPVEIVLPKADVTKKDLQNCIDKREFTVLMDLLERCKFNTVAVELAIVELLKKNEPGIIEAILSKLKNKNDVSRYTMYLVNESLLKNKAENAKIFARKLSDDSEHDAAFYSIFSYYKRIGQHEKASEIVPEFRKEANRVLIRQMHQQHHTSLRRPHLPEIRFVEDYQAPRVEEANYGDYMTDEQLAKFLSQTNL